MNEYGYHDFETLPELSNSQQARLDALIDDYELAIAEDASFTIERLVVDDPELIPHLRSAITQLQQVDLRLQSSTVISLPQEIEGFQFKTVMGSGATGVVFKCAQQDGNRDVAVKVMKPDLDIASQQVNFQREITTAACVAGTGVVAIHQTGTTFWSGKECFWFSMELLEGGTICAYARRKRLSIQERLSLARSVCSTLDRLHQAGILHRDLKPSNILTSEDGHPYVVDFGIAKFTNDSVGIHKTETDAPSRRGTIAWSAPELLRYESRTPADVRSEVFSVGLILFDLLAERHPFAANNESAFDVSQRIINEPAPLLSSALPTVSPDLECFVGKLLEADPADRYQSYSEVISEIDCLLTGAPVQARRLSFFERSNRFLVRHKTAILGGTLAVLALVFTTLRFYFLSETLGTQQRLLQASNSQLVEQQDVLANRSNQLQNSILQRDRSLRNSRLLNLSLLVASDPRGTRAVLDDNDMFHPETQLLAWRSLWNDSRWDVETLLKLDSSAAKLLFADDINRLLIVSLNRETFLFNLKQQAIKQLNVECFRRSQLVRRPEHDTCLFLDQHSTLCEVDLIEGEIVGSYPITAGIVGRLTFTSNGSLAAGVNREGKLFVLDLASPEQQRIISDASTPLVCNWFSDSDRLLCALTRDGKILKWDWQVQGGDAIQTIDLVGKGLPQEDVRIARYFSRMNGGEALLIRTEMGKVYTYRPTAFADQPLTRIPLGAHGEIPRRLTLAQPETLFALERSVIEYPLNGSYSPRLFPVFQGQVTAFAMSETGQRVAIGNTSGEIAITSVPSARVTAREFAPLSQSNDMTTGYPTVLANHPLRGNVAIGYSGGWVRIEAGESPGRFVDWQVSNGPVTDIGWHPHGLSLVVSVGGASPVLCLCKLGHTNVAAMVKDQSKRALLPTDKGVRRVRFSPCGDFLLLALRDGRVLKLEAASLKILAEWKFHATGCFGLDVMQDYLITGDSDGMICLRNWKSGELLRSWQGHKRRVADVQFSPDQNLIFSCGYDSTLRSWTLDGELVRTFSGHNQEVTDLAFADDGQTLMSGGRDRSIKFWDAGTGELQRSIVAQTAEIKDLLYHSDRDQLLSASVDGTIRIIVD